MNLCPFCFAEVLDVHMRDHVRWHAAHKLHRHTCARLYTVDAPEYCDCGLDQLTALAQEQSSE